MISTGFNFLGLSWIPMPRQHSPPSPIPQAKLYVNKVTVTKRLKLLNIYVCDLSRNNIGVTWHHRGLAKKDDHSTDSKRDIYGYIFMIMT